MNWRLASVLILGIFVGALVTGSVPVSSASSGEITVCVRKNGAMYMIGENFKRSDCRKGEQLIAFNAQGQVGQQGPQGVAGKDGTTIPCVHTEGNDVYFDGCNVHVRDGSGDTFATTNGLGNLIIGYNEDTGGPHDRMGSHNLVIGPYHTFSSFGGIVAGQFNTISAGSASVLGGVGNVANGVQSVISGGSGNISTGNSSSVSGGTFNTASGDNSSVSGGKYNETGGNASSISGGDHNTATANQSSVSGGRERTATGFFNWTAGALFQAN